jgi:hypothetical protein
MGGVGIQAGVLAVLLGIPAGCGVFDFSVDLQSQTFKLDFGQQSGTVPAVACDAAADVCGSTLAVNFDTSSMAGVPSDVEVAAGCDTSSGQCYAQANARAAQSVGVLQDDDFSSKVGRNGLAFVQEIDIGYTIPLNTLTFDIPQLDVYAGPAGSVRETDPGVALVGHTQPIAAGVTTTTQLHMEITDDTPARPVIENAIEHKQDFVFIVVAMPRMDAGMPLPAGAVQIDVFPSIVVGL